MARKKCRRPIPLAPRLAALWQTHKREPTLESRRRVAEQYIGLLRKIANMVSVRSAGGLLRPEELLASGTEGLLESIDRFDPARDVQFETFAAWAIRGRMLDYLRELDPLPRLVRGHVRKIERLRVRLGHEVREDDLEAAAGLAPHHFRIAIEAKKPESLSTRIFEQDGGAVVELIELLRDEADRPSRGLIDEHFWAIVLRGLNPAEFDLIWGLYRAGRTMKEVGKQLDLSQSRISQMHTEIVTRLREKLSAEELFSLLKAA